MNVNLESSVENKINNLAIQYGFAKEEIVERAIYYYLDSLKDEISFKEEFLEWDYLSDECLKKFESNIEQG
jgi:hypothetical protein